MKISPESFIEDEGLCLKYKSIFVSGNEEGYISSFVDFLVTAFSKNSYLRKSLGEKKDVSPDLFGANKKHVFICNKYVGNKSVEEIEGSG